MFQPLVGSILRQAARRHRSKPFAMRNAVPLVSFTFDDTPASAYTNGAATLDRHGVRGTFYVSGGLLGSEQTAWRIISRDQVRALHERGHEIGCHTFSHVRVDQVDARGLDEECRQNRDVLRALCAGTEPTNFCYPFGRISLTRKWQLEERFDSCRGIYQGINAGTVDLGLLKVIELYDRTLTPDKLQRVLRKTRARNGWLIFYTHDVAEAPSWIGCSPQMLSAAVQAVQAVGMACLPVRDALRAIGYGSQSVAANVIDAGIANAAPRRGEELSAIR
jgi:peptidoglycan/xylan/chitin deacetylase (PgdA/CDA1 family)